MWVEYDASPKSFSQFILTLGIWNSNQTKSSKNIQCQIARLHIFDSIEWMEYANSPFQKLQLFVDRKFGKFGIVKCPTPNVLIQNKNKKKMWIVVRCAGIIFCECVCAVRVWECNVSCRGNVVLMVQANYFCRNNYFHEFFSLSLGNSGTVNTARSDGA